MGSATFGSAFPKVTKSQRLVTAEQKPGREDVTCVSSSDNRGSVSGSGNISYDMHESVPDPTKMVFVEQWESLEALAPHGKTEHFKTFGRIVSKCAASPPKIEIITPAKVDVR